MEIIYCTECGSMVPPAEAAKGSYRLVDDEPVCSKCYRKIAKERGEVGVAPGSCLGPRRTCGTSQVPGS